MHNFKKRFGQNFLKNKDRAVHMVNSLELTKDDTVIEIGPGHGIVSELLAEKAGHVILIEIDDELIPFLENKFKDTPNVEIVHKDVLQLNLKDLKLKNYKLVGSLPYNIAKKIIFSFLVNDPRPETMSFILQKEVAENYTSKPPKKEFLANFAEVYSDTEYLETIKAGEFHPTPKVESAIIKFKVKQDIQKDPEKLIKFIKVAYSSPRKKLSSNLSHGLKIDKEKVEKALEKLDINLNSRPAELTIDAWKGLFKLLNV